MFPLSVHTAPVTPLRAQEAEVIREQNVPNPVAYYQTTKQKIGPLQNFSSFSMPSCIRPHKKGWAVSLKVSSQWNPAPPSSKNISQD